MCFTCVKNALEDAKKKNPADCALSAEADIYACNARLLELAGAEIESPADVSFMGIPAKIGARIVLHPSFGISLVDIKSKVKGKVKITRKSVLVLDGDITVDGLDLDGALKVTGSGALKDKVVQNASRPLEAIPEAELSGVAEDMKIRGYRQVEGEMEDVTLPPCAM